MFSQLARSGTHKQIPQLTRSAWVTTCGSRTALAKRMKKMQDLADKFNAAAEDLTEIQSRFLGSHKLPEIEAVAVEKSWLKKTFCENCSRLKVSIVKSINEMEAVHKEMSDDYSNGVVTGYSKKLLVRKELSRSMEAHHNFVLGSFLDSLQSRLEVALKTKLETAQKLPETQNKCYKWCRTLKKC